MQKNTIKIMSGIVLVSGLFIGCSQSTNDQTKYQCPMKCEGVDTTYTKPGKCPVCKMDLKQIEL